VPETGLKKEKKIYKKTNQIIPEIIFQMVEKWKIRLIVQFFF
jgi:hypothetical protein